MCLLLEGVFDRTSINNPVYLPNLTTTIPAHLYRPKHLHRPGQGLRKRRRQPQSRGARGEGHPAPLALWGHEWITTGRGGQDAAVLSRTHTRVNRQNANRRDAGKDSCFHSSFIVLLHHSVWLFRVVRALLAFFLVSLRAVCGVRGGIVVAAGTKGSARFARSVRMSVRPPDAPSAGQSYLFEVWFGECGVSAERSSPRWRRVGRFG